MPLTQAEVDALRNATRVYGGSVEIVPRAQYVDPNVQARFDDLAARVAGVPTPPPARAAGVPAVQAQFNALAERIAPQTIQNTPAGRVAPVQREGMQGPPNYYNVPGAGEAYEQYGVPPMLFQRDPYATAGYMAGPDGSVRPLVGYPSRYPHVLNGVPQNYAAPYLQNAWGMLGPWIAPPNPAAIESLVQAVRQPQAQARPRPAGSAPAAQRSAKAKPTPEAAAQQAPARNTGDYAADAVAEAMGAPAIPAPVYPEVRGPYSDQPLENPYNGYMMGFEPGDRVPLAEQPLDNPYNGYMMGFLPGGEPVMIPEVRGQYSSEVRAPMTNEVRGAYNPEPVAVPPVTQDIGILGISPLARNVMQNPVQAPAAFPEVRGAIIPSALSNVSR